MGNTSRRPSQAPNSADRNSSSKSSSAKNVRQQNLAPKTVLSGGDVECPICFMNYEEFNTAICCKQAICTDCFLQLKVANTEVACPFCSHDGFNVTYEPTPGQSLKSTESRETSERLSNSTSSPGNNPTLQYTTPEQDKKLRSTSFDKSGTPVASKADREAIEAEILKQRTDSLMHDFSSSGSRPFRSPAVTRSASVPVRAESISSSFGRRPDLQRFATERTHGNAAPPRRRQSHSRDDHVVPPLPPAPYMTGSGFLDHDESGDFFSDEDAHLLVALQSLLSADGMSPSTPTMPSLEQLEEMMLMEAIRQSMREAEATSTGSSQNSEVLTAPNESDRSQQDGVASVTTENEVAVAAPAPQQDVTAESLAIPPRSPERASPNRLLEDIERALNTPPRPPSRSS